MALIKFYGETCAFCKQMESLDAKLEKELGVKLERLEVWNNEQNREKMLGYHSVCQGVPMYINEETKVVLCGAVDYEILKRWAKGEELNQPEHSHEDDEHDQAHKSH